MAVKRKNVHAVALGAKGGKARAKKLTAEQRSDIARLGANATNLLKKSRKTAAA